MDGQHSTWLEEHRPHGTPEPITSVDGAESYRCPCGSTLHLIRGTGSETTDTINRLRARGRSTPTEAHAPEHDSPIER
jgi:hypothetical protein